MKTVLLVALLGLFLVPLRAEDWTTLDGKTYQNVRVLSHNAAYVTILHENGGGRIPLSTLQPEVRARFGYDAAKAQAVVATTRAADQRDKVALAQEMKRSREIADQQQEQAARALATALFSPPSNSMLLASGRSTTDSFSNQSLNGALPPDAYTDYPASYDSGYSAYYGYEDGYGNDLGYGYPGYAYGGGFFGYRGYGFGYGRTYPGHFGGHGSGGGGHHH